MKLSLSNFSANQYLQYGETERSVLRAIRDSGFTCTDVDVLPSYLEDDKNKNAARIRSLLDEIGLTAVMAHAPMVNPVKRSQEALDLTVKAIRFCQDVGISRVVVHPGAIVGNTREEFFEKNVRFYRSLISYMEETGVFVLAENIGNYDDSYFLWNGADLREMVDRVDHPLFGACWDSGHANHFFEKDCTQYESILALGEKLMGLHAHDNCGYIADSYKHSRMDLHTIPYFASPASVNWDAVMQGLKDINYQGAFNFEVKSPAISTCDPFIYNGEVQAKLDRMPLSVWTTVNTALYQMGKHMLTTYDLFEM